MLVKLKRNWFYEGVRYRFKDRHGVPYIQEMPDSFLEFLPSDAVIFNDQRAKIGTAGEVRDGKVAAKAAGSSDAEAEAQAKAEAEKANALKAVDDLKAALAAAEKELEAAADNPGKKAAATAKVNATKNKLAEAEKATQE